MTSVLSLLDPVVVRSVIRRRASRARWHLDVDQCHPPKRCPLPVPRSAGEGLADQRAGSAITIRQRRQRGIDCRVALTASRHCPLRPAAHQEWHFRQPARSALRVLVTTRGAAVIGCAGFGRELGTRRPPVSHLQAFHKPIARRLCHSAVPAYAP